MAGLSRFIHDNTVRLMFGCKEFVTDCYSGCVSGLRVTNDAAEYDVLIATESRQIAESTDKPKLQHIFEPPDAAFYNLVGVLIHKVPRVINSMVLLDWR